MVSHCFLFWIQSLVCPYLTYKRPDYMAKAVRFTVNTWEAEKQEAHNHRSARWPTERRVWVKHIMGSAPSEHMKIGMSSENHVSTLQKMSVFWSKGLLFWLEARLGALYTSAAEISWDPLWVQLSFMNQLSTKCHQATKAIREPSGCLSLVPLDFNRHSKFNSNKTISFLWSGNHFSHWYYIDWFSASVAFCFFKLSF